MTEDATPMEGLTARTSLASRMDALSEQIADRSVPMLRIAIGVVFFWFGALKLIPRLSPAEALAGKTIFILTPGLLKLP